MFPWTLLYDYLNKKNWCDSILVIADRFSIMGHFISCHNTDYAYHFVELYFHEVVHLYGAQMTDYLLSLDVKLNYL